MSDIVKGFRLGAALQRAIDGESPRPNNFDIAADAIEQRDARIKDLEAALEAMFAAFGSTDPSCWTELQDAAVKFAREQLVSKEALAKGKQND